MWNTTVQCFVLDTNITEAWDFKQLFEKRDLSVSIDYSFDIF